MIAGGFLRKQDYAPSLQQAEKASVAGAFVSIMSKNLRMPATAAPILAVSFAAWTLLAFPSVSLAQTPPESAQAPPATTQAFRYVVELAVPEAQRKLLQDNLEIYTARDNPRMNADQLRFLVRRTPEQMRELLATEGYYSPSIESTLEERQGAWTARFAITPGETSRVADVKLELRGAISGEESLARLTRMRERWPLSKGLVFRQSHWEAAKRSVLQLLLAEQYPAAKIASSQATVDPKTRQVSLQVVLDSGPAFSFGDLEVSGLERYPQSIVERLNVIKPDSPYSQAKLLQLQSRLQDSRYFTGATVSTDTDPERPVRVPVKVQVAEAQSRKLGFGAGASTNSGARGQLEYEDLNFLDRAWRLSGLLKLESKKQLLSGEIQFPRTENGYVDSVSALTERTDIENVLTRKHTLGAKRARVIGNTEKAYSLQYETEHDVIDGVLNESSQALVPGYAWTRRQVDNLLYPSEGYLLSAQVGVATKALLSDQDFVRNHLKGTYYRRVGSRGGLILRAELGATLARSREGIPSDFLFRAGGDQSVRGYAYQSLGVKLGDAIVGGRYLGLASAEYVHWLKPQWGAAVFYDLGTAADSLRDFHPVHGYGAGARWKSPVGLLKLDLAHGREAGKTRVHFSVGISF
ncbi:MAG: outer membrane protein assembly factor [Burkholderiales bacterium]|nr:outer membrane protein assembly factor [Burkholderiales bacterium]